MLRPWSYLSIRLRKRRFIEIPGKRKEYGMRTLSTHRSHRDAANVAGNFRYRRRGKLVYQNGKVDGKGNIDSHSSIYNTVFGDENDKPTLHVWSATHIISDNRIPPKGQKEEHFVCLVPNDTKSPLKMKAVLHYRSAPQDVVDALLARSP